MNTISKYIRKEFTLLGYLQFSIKKTERPILYENIISYIPKLSGAPLEKILEINIDYKRNIIKIIFSEKRR